MVEISSEDISSFEHWQENPLLWVKAIFGDNIKKKSGLDTETGLSIQQEMGLEELRRLILAKLKVGSGDKLTRQDKLYAGKIGLSIQSGQGTGKDFFASLVILYFLYCFPNCKVPCTANSSKQLRNVLWSEISKVMSLSLRVNPSDLQSETLLEHLFEWQSEKIFLKSKKGRRWFAEAVTIATNASVDSQAETLGGRHEDFMLFVIDEASGIPEPVFRPIEGTLSGVLNIVLMIFNPTRSTGFAVKSHKENSDRWVTFRWNAEESELVSAAHCLGMKEKYGVDSNPYRIRVLGLPPLADSDALIPWDWLEDASDRDLEPLERDFVIKGWDFGAGGDKSIIATRKGGKVFPFKRNSTKDSNVLTDWCESDFISSEANIGYGDVIGIGWAIMGNLRKKLGGNKARSVDSRGRADNDMRFFNKRAENYWNLRTAFENKEISIPKDEGLINQLGATKYTEETGRIKINPKATIKKEIEGDSPDEADALANMYSNTVSVHRRMDDEDDWSSEVKKTRGWMAA